MLYKKKNDVPMISKPHLHTIIIKPGQTKAQLHEGKHGEQVSLCEIRVNYSSNDLFKDESQALYMVNHADQKLDISSQEYSFSDLVDINLLQKLFTSYYMITKIPHAVLDTDNNILCRFGWHDICAKYHRICPDTLQRCLQSDNYISAHLHKVPYIGYRCLNGLVDYATPIVIEGRHLATIFIGQFFHEPPDVDFFRHQAQNYGFNEEAYLEALREVPIIPKNQIEFIMQFFSEFAQFLAILGLQRKRELEATNQALRDREKSEVKYRSIFENATEGIFQTTPQGRFISINPAFAKIYGFESAEEMITEIPNIRRAYYDNPDDWRKLVRQLADQDKSEKFETSVNRKDGNKIRVSLNIHVVRDQNGAIQYLEGTCVDITERVEAQARLEYLSYKDSLTGLYNRNYFEAEMQRLQELGRIPIGIIMCDFDGLKLINDTLGRKIGDELLVAASQALKACFRDEDVVARVGGDEFSIILPFINESKLAETVDRIRTEIDIYNIRRPDLPLSISIGFAYKNQDNLTNIDDLYKQADDNMFREKLTRSQSAHSAIVKTLIQTMEARDFETEKHAERLINLINAFAREINLNESQLAHLLLFARFHDIGKVGIPDSILLKPGPLTPEERIQMQSHSEIGYRIAHASHDLTPIADLILKHHEWWNGKGYPLGLAGRDIPLECRILAIADAYDAMTSNRPYRKARSHHKAIAELKRTTFTQFDPDLVEIFIALLRNPSLAGTSLGGRTPVI